MQQEASCPPVTVLMRPLSPNEYIHLQEREAPVASFRVTTLYESNPLAMRTLARKISCKKNQLQEKSVARKISCKKNQLQRKIKMQRNFELHRETVVFFFYKLNIH
jgi:hypothetical protein